MARNLSETDSDVNDYVDSLNGQAYDTDTRMRLLVTCITLGKNDWKAMERETGVKAERWRQFARGATKASVEMAEAIAARWPQYAFWLLTGVSDEKHGHHAPHEMWSFPGYNPDPEYDESGKISHYEKTSDYFRLASRLAKQVWNAGGPRIRMSGGVIHTDKFQKARKADKVFDRDADLLLTLSMLKDKEFLANNSELEESDSLDDLLREESKNDDQAS